MTTLNKSEKGYKIEMNKTKLEGEIWNLAQY